MLPNKKAGAVTSPPTLSGFNWLNPTKVIFGPGRLAELPEVLEQVAGGQSRVFLVTGQSHLRQSGILHKVLEGIGSSRITLFDRVAPFPGPQLVSEAVDACRQSSPQVVVAIGGRQPLPDEDIEALEEILRNHPKFSNQQVRDQYVLDHGEEDAPAVRTISKYLSPIREKIKNSQDEAPVKPWDHWGVDPEEIKTFFAVHRVAINICDKYKIGDFVGITARQTNWVKRLRPFFNLSDYFETAWLLDFAIRFADDEKFARDMGRRFTPRIAATNLLEKWQWKSAEWPQANQYLKPPAPWEIGDNVEQRIAIALGYKPPIYKPSIEPRVQQAQSPDPSTNRFLDQFRAQGFPIDEDHASLGMVYTDPPEREEPEVAEEELLDGVYRVTGMTTTDQMIIPVEAPGASGSQNSLTQDAVMKLVSELLEDPGSLGRERAAELGMDLVATVNEILNRHVGEQERENNNV